LVLKDVAGACMITCMRCSVKHICQRNEEPYSEQDAARVPELTDGWVEAMIASLAKEPYIGQILRQVRESGGVSLRDLSRELGINETQLSRIENGERRIPDGLEAKYFTAVREIVKRRAQAVGLLPKDPDKK
jgi:ribosome-binding protein aMBF1 (putative translation factor)